MRTDSLPRRRVPSVVAGVGSGRTVRITLIPQNKQNPHWKQTKQTKKPILKTSKHKQNKQTHIGNEGSRSGGSALTLRQQQHSAPNSRGPATTQAACSSHLAIPTARAAPTRLGLSQSTIVFRSRRNVYCMCYESWTLRSQEMSRFSDYTVIRRINCAVCSTRPPVVDEPLYGVPSDAMLC